MLEYEVAKLIENNFSAKIKHFADCNNNTIFRHINNMSYIRTEAASDSLNMICGINQGSFKEEITEIISWHEYYPFTWVIKEQDHNEQINQFFLKFGLEVDSNLRFMLADLNSGNILPYQKHNKLKIVKANNQKEFSDFCLVFSLVFEKNMYVIDPYYKELCENIDNNKYNIYVCYHDNIPASVCSIYYDGKIAGVYDVATHPSFRRKGIAKNMLSYVLEEIKNNKYEKVGLQASAQGEDLYYKLGFQKYGLMYLYSNRKLVKERV